MSVKFGLTHEDARAVDAARAKIASLREKAQAVVDKWPGVVDAQEPIYTSVFTRYHGAKEMTREGVKLLIYCSLNVDFRVFPAHILFVRSPRH